MTIEEEQAAEIERLETERNALRAENEKLRDQLSINKETTQKFLIELQYAEEKRSELFENSIDRSCEIVALKEEIKKLKADIKRRDEFTKVDYDLIGDLGEARSKIKQENDNLRAENEKLRAALKPFADIAKQTEHWSGPPVSVPLYVIRAAAAALNDTKSDNK